MRRVRKVPLTEKLRTYPIDLLISLNEVRLSIDWDDYNYYGMAGAMVLNAVFIVINRWSFNPTENTRSMFQIQNYNEYKQKVLLNSGDTLYQSGYGGFNPGVKHDTDLWYRLNQSVIFVVYAMAFANAVHLLWFSHKTYSLLYTNNKPKSPSVQQLSILKSSSGIDVDDDGDSTNIISELLSLLGRVLNNVLDNITPRFLKTLQEESYYNDTETTNNSTTKEKEYNLFDKDIYQLIMWNPLKFQLVLFCFLNPLLLIINQLLLSTTSIWKLLITNWILNYQLYYIVDKFFVLVSDKQIVYQEMFQEFNNKFVKPKTNILRRDVGIDTKDFNNEIIEQTNPFFQNTKSKVFITHDLDGKPFNTGNIERDSVDNINIDDIDYETMDYSTRRKLHSDKIKKQVEMDKQINHQTFLNNSLLEHSNSDWMNSTINANSTPFRKLPSMYSNTPSKFDRSYRSTMRSPTNRTSERSFNRSFNTSPDRSILRSPDRSILRSPDRSPDRFNRSPTRAPGNSMISPNRSNISNVSPSRSKYNFSPSRASNPNRSSNRSPTRPYDNGGPTYERLYNESFK